MHPNKYACVAAPTQQNSCVAQAPISYLYQAVPHAEAPQNQPCFASYLYQAVPHAEARQNHHCTFSVDRQFTRYRSFEQGILRSCVDEEDLPVRFDIYEHSNMLPFSKSQTFPALPVETSKRGTANITAGLTFLAWKRARI